MRLLFAITALLLSSAVRAETPQEREPGTITVHGRGELWLAPDTVAVTVGAVAQSREAAVAQREVSQIVRRTVDAFVKLGLKKEALATQAIVLSPVYEEPSSGRQPEGPRLAGYRASNSIQVRLTDLGRVGDVVDAAVRAGANQIEDVTFRVANEGDARQRALRAAVEDARAKAQAIASALDTRLAGLVEVSEQQEQLFEPRRRFALAEAAAGTPVEPGQVRIEANVLAKFRLPQP